MPRPSLDDIFGSSTAVAEPTGGVLSPKRMPEESPKYLDMNKAWAKPGPYRTQLDPATEASMRQWVKKNNIPFNPDEQNSGYDMRGYYKDVVVPGKAGHYVDPYDHKVHYPDTYKTPYDLTFSKESKYATPNAPHWKDNRYLIDSQGQIIYDDKAGARIGGVLPRKRPPLDSIFAKPIEDHPAMDSLKSFGQDVAHVAAKGVGGITQGVTLGVMNPNEGTVGIPFTSIKKQIVPPLAESVDKLTGRVAPENADFVQDVVAPTVAGWGQFAGTAGPWSGISKLVGRALGATSTAVGAVGAPATSIAEKAGAMARRVATQGITGATVMGAQPRDKGESLLKNVATGAAYGAGLAGASEGLQWLARLPQNMKNVAMQNLAHDLSDFLYRSGKAPNTDVADNMAADAVLGEIHKQGGDVKYSDIKKTHAVIKNVLSGMPNIEKPVGAYVPDETGGLLRKITQMRNAETAQDLAVNPKPSPSTAFPLGTGSMPPAVLPTASVPDERSQTLRQQMTIQAAEEAQNAGYEQRPQPSKAEPLGQGTRPSLDEIFKAPEPQVGVIGKSETNGLRTIDGQVPYLDDWVRRTGGIKSNDAVLGGELRGIGLKEGMNGILNNKTGVPLEEKYQQAITEGLINPDEVSLADFPQAIKESRFNRQESEARNAFAGEDMRAGRLIYDLDLNPGDKVQTAKDTYTYKGSDEKGNEIFKDKKTLKVHELDDLPQEFAGAMKLKSTFDKPLGSEGQLAKERAQAEMGSSIRGAKDNAVSKAGAEGTLFNPHTPDLLDEAKPKEPWQMTRDEYMKANGESVEAHEAHHRAVEEALTRGESVPANVLSYYPGLQRQFGSIIDKLTEPLKNQRGSIGKIENKFKTPTGEIGAFISPNGVEIGRQVATHDLQARDVLRFLKEAPKNPHAAIPDVIKKLGFVRMTKSFDGKEIGFEASANNPAGLKIIQNRLEQGKNAYSRASVDLVDAGKRVSLTGTPTEVLNKLLFNERGSIDINKIPGVTATADLITDTGRRLRDVFAPSIGAPSESKNAIYKMMGEADKQDALLRARPDLKKLDREVAKWDDKQKIDYLDKVRSGQIDQLEGPERELYEIGQTLDEGLRPELQKRFPDMPFRDFHAMMTVKWRLPEDDRPFYAPPRLGGDQGFKKKYSGKSVSELIDSGLKPKTLNPVQMMMESANDRVKTLALADFLEEATHGRWKYVPNGEDAPEGFAKLSDSPGGRKIAEVFKKLLYPQEIQGEEHVDKATYDGLMGVAHDLGLEPERVINAGRARLGYASTAGEVVTQHNTELSVLAHEIGHQLDFKYGLWDKIVTDQEGVGKRGEVTKSATSARKGTIQKELRALTDLYAEGHDVSPYFQTKIRKQAEKMARMLEAYISAPEKFKEVAPTVYGIFDDFIKSTPELKKLSEIKPGISLQDIEYTHKIDPPLFMKSFDVLDSEGNVVNTLPNGQDAKAHAELIGGKVKPHPVFPKFMKAGEWYAPTQEAAMLKNHLSRDAIRATSLGRGLMEVKNLYTQIELGLSTFHGSTIAQETMASRTGLVLQQIANGDFEGLNQTLNPKNFVTIPKLLNAYMKNPDIEKNPEFQKLTKAAFGPNAKEMSYYLNAYFKGGAILTRDVGLKPHALDKLRRGEWGGVVKLPVEIASKTTEFLFENVIPKAKFMQFTLELNHNLKIYDARIKAGKMTEEDVWRITARRIENRFGEMNWEKFFLPRTIKTALQLIFRSPTWSYGTWANIGGAIPEQIREVQSAIKEGRRPVLEGKLAWLVGMVAWHVLEAMTIGYGMSAITGEDLRPKTFFDYAFPKISTVSRIRIPGYGNEPISLYEAAKKGQFYLPVEYMKNKLAGMWGKIAEVWNNKDYYGAQVRNPDDSIPKQTVDIAGHVLPQPISVQSARQSLRDFEPRGVALSAAGFTKAPGYVNKTAAQEVIDKIFQDKGQVGGKSKEEVAIAKARHEAIVWLRQGKRIQDMPNDLKQSLRKLTTRQRNNILKDSKLTPLQASFSSNYISGLDALKVWKVATPEEKAELQDLFLKKVASYYGRLTTQEDKDAFKKQFNAVFNKAEFTARRERATARREGINAP